MTLQPVPPNPPRAVQPPAVDVAWEIFHENSKTGRLRGMLPDHAVVERMQALHESLHYTGRSEFRLPPPHALDHVSLQTAFDHRESGRSLTEVALTLDDLATILHHAYGVRERQPEGPYPRAFRTVPSGGALFPMEIYVHASSVLGLPVGLFHYEPAGHVLRQLRCDSAESFADALVQPEIARTAAVTLFLTAVFYRSTFKYGNRGYRFVLLEAGHVGQNVDLTAAALGLAAINIGGYFDRAVDAYLDLDGIRQSAVYLAAIGGRAEPSGS